MSTDHGEHAPTAAELDAMTTGELRQRAFAAAEHRHDLRFFWDLVKHLRAGEDFAADDGSAGGLGESVTGLVELVQGLLGNDDGGALEPMLRARYIEYLTNRT